MKDRWRLLLERMYIKYGYFLFLRGNLIIFRWDIKKVISMYYYFLVAV